MEALRLQEKQEEARRLKKKEEYERVLKMKKIEEETQKQRQIEQERLKIRNQKNLIKKSSKMYKNQINDFLEDTRKAKEDPDGIKVTASASFKDNLLITHGKHLNPIAHK